MVGKLAKSHKWFRKPGFVLFYNCNFLLVLDSLLMAQTQIDVPYVFPSIIINDDLVCSIYIYLGKWRKTNGENK